MNAISTHVIEEEHGEFNGEIALNISDVLKKPHYLIVDFGIFKSLARYLVYDSAVMIHSVNNDQIHVKPLKILDVKRPRLESNSYTISTTLKDKLSIHFEKVNADQN
ncbi:MAG: hypothetical protein ACSHX0_01830 [Akkermansiaceae bacterium]